MTDDNRVVANEHVFDHQTDDALSLHDVKRGRGFAQPRQKCRQRFREMQVRRSFSRLVGNRLQLHSQRALALVQSWHSLAKLLQRQEVLLISGQ